MDSPVDQIKSRLPIQECIGGYITLEKSGANWKARCPFHNERTPSFYVSADRGSYYCFGCGAKGDVFSFVQAFEGLDFVGALKLLAEKTGVQLKSESYSHLSNKDRQWKILESATAYYEKVLEKSDEARNYLLARGLTEHTMKSWRIGYARDAWRDMYEFLVHKGVSKEEMISVGLVKEGDKGTVYDRFRDRIMFPIFDGSGRVVGFSGRILHDTLGAAKYLNSPETELFKKSEILYGLDRAKASIRSEGRAILVEGQMDLLMCHQSGITSAIATSGTALTSQHLDLLKRFASGVILCFDNDKAGLSASKRAFQIALEKDLEVSIASLDAGKDPAEILQSDPKGLSQALENSKHIIEVVLDSIVEQNIDPKTRAEAVSKNLVPLVASISKAIERGHFVSMIAHMLNVKEDAIWEDIKSIKRDIYPSRTSLNTTLAKKSRYDIIIDQIWSLQLYIEAKDHVQAQSAKDKIKKILGEESFQAIAEARQGRKDELMFQAEMYYAGKDSFKESDDLIRELDLEISKAVFANCIEELARAEKLEDKPLVEKLLAECNKLTIHINNLKTGYKSDI